MSTVHNKVKMRVCHGNEIHSQLNQCGSMHIGWEYEWIFFQPNKRVLWSNIANSHVYMRAILAANKQFHDVILHCWKYRARTSNVKKLKTWHKCAARSRTLQFSFMEYYIDGRLHQRVIHFSHTTTIRDIPIEHFDCREFKSLKFQVSALNELTFLQLHNVREHLML